MYKQDNGELFSPNGERELVALPVQEEEGQTTQQIALPQAPKLPTEEDFEKFRQVMATLRKYLILETRPQDWVDFGGRPYLMGAGLKRMIGYCTKLGVSIINPRKEFIKREGETIVMFMADAVFQGSVFPVVGTKSTKDKFFAKRTDDEGNVYYLPEEEVDLQDVIKAALTNLYVNALTTVLGLQNLRWEDLEELGLDKSKVARVQFKSKKSKSKTTPQRKSNSPEKKKESVEETQMKAIKKLQERLGLSDASLEQYSKDLFGKSLKDLTTEEKGQLITQMQEIEKPIPEGE